MSMSKEAAKLHEEYETTSGADRELIDECYNAIRREMVSFGETLDNSDATETLAAHIYEYIKASRE